MADEPSPRCAACRRTSGHDIMCPIALGIINKNKTDVARESLDARKRRQAIFEKHVTECLNCADRAPGLCGAGHTMLDHYLKACAAYALVVRT